MESTAHVLDFPQRDEQRAVKSFVVRQDLQTVYVSNGSQFPLKSFLRIGDGERVFIGLLVGHRDKTAVVEVLAQKRSQHAWGSLTHSIPINTPVQLVEGGFFEEFLKNRYTRPPVACDFVFAPDLEATAFVPDLVHEVTLVIGQRGSGKSTTRMRLVANALKSSNLYNGRKPGTLIFDPHGDDFGRVQVLGGLKRVGLIDVLPPEDVVIISPENFRCNVQDLPAPQLLKFIAKLSPSQQSWANLYVTKKKDHYPILCLLKHDPAEWAADFPALTVDGELPKPKIDSLTSLRGYLTGFICEPLFAPPIFEPSDPNSEKSKKFLSWIDVVSNLYAGKSVFIDLGQFPEIQQTILVSLLIRALMFYQYDRLNSGKPLHPIFITGDEMHRFSAANELLCKLVLEARKYFLAPIFSSQELSHFSSTIVDSATCAVVLRSEGKTLDSIKRRWHQSRYYASDLAGYPPGCGLLLYGGNQALPVRFQELT